VDEHAEPLPKVAYDTISQKRLREILEEQELPATGDRPAMVARHARYVVSTLGHIAFLPEAHRTTVTRHRWVNMFNANLDASVAQRKTRRQLLTELRRWDETEERKRTRPKLDPKKIDPEEYQVSCGITCIEAGWDAYSVVS
jgi:E3 ubiquitin-protein ligase RAD18